MIRRGSSAIPCALAALYAPVAHAEPRFAVQTGLDCAACHVDPAGAGLATDRGLAWARDDLATFVPAGAWDPRIGAIARIGAVLRAEDELTFPVATTLGDVPFEAPGGNAFALTEIGLRFQVEPVADRVTLVVDEDLAAARLNTAFAMVQGPSRSWVKGGWIAERWGLGVRTATALAHEVTAAPEGAGLEAGATTGPLSLALALTSGMAPEGRVFTGRRVSAIAEVRTAAAWAGVSVALDDIGDARFPVATRAGALHAGAHTGHLVALGEIDLSRGETSAEAFVRAAAYAEVDVEVHPGVYVQGTYERYDPLLAVAENVRDRTTLGGTWYPVPHLAIEARFALGRDIPQLPEGNADSVRIGVRGSL